MRYSQLKIIENNGYITKLELQPRFLIHVNGIKICTYVADFSYLDKESNMTIIEDVKGVKTPVYKIKKKLVEAIYGIKITEIK